MSGSRFTYELHKLPAFALVLKQDGRFIREVQFEYADAAEQQGIEWVARQEEALRATMDIHPAGSQLPPGYGRHVRLAEDAA